MATLTKIIIVTISLILLLIFMTGIILTLGVDSTSNWSLLRFLFIKGSGLLLIYISFTILWKLDLIQRLSKY